MWFGVCVRVFMWWWCVRSCGGGGGGGGGVCSCGLCVHVVVFMLCVC